MGQQLEPLAKELKILLTRNREYFLELSSASYPNNICPVAAVETKGQGTIYGRLGIFQLISYGKGEPVCCILIAVLYWERRRNEFKFYSVIELTGWPCIISLSLSISEDC